MTKGQLKGCEFLLAESGVEQVYIPEEFTDEHRQISETCEQFVNNEVLPNIDEIDSQNFELVVDLLRQAGELGLMMVDGPEEYGGLDLDKVTSMLVAEKLGHSGSFCVACMAHSGIGTLPLVYYGTPEQKERYLEPLLTMETVGAYCLTEPGSGSDALGASASAILSEDGKHYILNGTKQFITNAAFAGLFTVFAKIDKEHFTAFLVERDFEGLNIGIEEKKLGIKGSSTCQVILDNVKVPVENLLGEIGKGHKIAFNVLNVGRFKLGAGAVGSMKQAFNDAVGYAIDRKQFNTSITKFGAIKEKLADMTADIFASESIVYRLAGLLDDRLMTLDKESDNYYVEYQKGIEEYAAECAITKVFCSEVLAFVTDESLQVHGGYGFVSEYPAERHYRDARIARIYEGTNEINRILIPGILFGKGQKGELPLQEAFGTVCEENFISSTSTACDVIKARCMNLKSIFLILANAAATKYQKQLSQEQEVLMSLADLAIQVFALESVVLRVEKVSADVSETRKKLYEAAAEVFSFRAVQNCRAAAAKGACYLAEGEELKKLNMKINRLAELDAVDLLGAKRALADASSDAEKYIF